MKTVHLVSLQTKIFVANSNLSRFSEVLIIDGKSILDISLCSALHFPELVCAFLIACRRLCSSVLMQVSCHTSKFTCRRRPFAVG